MTSTWTEVYRPHTLSQIYHQDTVVAALQQFLSTRDMPNLLFYGPQGTGKTTAIQAFAHDLFQASYKERVFELNASSERGVAAVRTRIKPLSQLSIKDGFRLIILEEADALTRDAQAALRRILEDSAQTTRVCLCCNYVSQIIEPLASRCAKFKFQPLPAEKIGERLLFIASSERFYLTDAAAKKIALNARGDMRKAVTDLYMHAFMGEKIVDDVVCDNFMRIQGELDDAARDSILACWMPDGAKGTGRVPDNDCQATLDGIRNGGYNIEKVALGLFEHILQDDRFGDEFRVKMGQEYARFGGFLARRGGECAAFSRLFWACRSAGCFE